MRIIETKDFKKIAKLNEHVQNVHVKLFPHIFKQYNEEEVTSFFKSIIDHPKYRFLLLEKDDMHIGYAWIEQKEQPENAFKKATKSLYVHQISINASERHRGYGAKMLDEICDIAKKLEINRIELDYWIENTMAKTFYERKGFTVYREVVFKTLSLN